VSTLLAVSCARRTALATIALALTFAGTARAEGGAYEAKWLTQSAYPTLESGETVTSWFEAQNVGTEPWTNDIVRLGTTNPRDRTSAFANSSWIYPWRPTNLDQSFVQPGQNGRFTFTMTGPPVSATTQFSEFFAPVADGKAWMENDASNWPPNGVYLTYTVIPAQPPSVAISSSPASVPAGTPVTVKATASDNRRVGQVQFQLAGGKATVDKTSPYEATLSSSGLAPGAQRIDVTAIDLAGHSAGASTNVNLDEVPNGANASRDVTMTAGFGKKRSRPRVTIPYGNATLVRGKLKTKDGKPVTGAVIRIATQILTGSRGYREQRPVSTGQDGGYVYRAPRGPSRRILITYTPFAVDTKPAVVKLVRMKTRAGLRMNANKRSVRRGGRIVFTGRLKGGFVPRRGVLVSLQGFQRDFGWRTFKTARARHGRFKGVYRPQRALHGTTLRFRAAVREQAGYPWALGRSRSVRVRIR
jgi:Bacterial Ig domain